MHHVGAKQKFGESLAEHKTPRWGVSDSSRHKEKEGYVARIRDSLLADARRIWQEDGWGGRLHSHLRLYCVLVRAGELSPTHEEVWSTLTTVSSLYVPVSSGRQNVQLSPVAFSVLSNTVIISATFLQCVTEGGISCRGLCSDYLACPVQVDFWLRALGNSLKDTEFVSTRTLQLGMAFVCLVSGLAGPSTKNLFHSAMGCLLKAATVTTTSACTPANVELAVWLAVQLLLRKFQEIAVVLESTSLNSLS